MPDPLQETTEISPHDPPGILHQDKLQALLQPIEMDVPPLVRSLAAVSGVELKGMLCLNALFFDTNIHTCNHHPFILVTNGNHALRLSPTNGKPILRPLGVLKPMLQLLIPLLVLISY